MINNTLVDNLIPLGTGGGIWIDDLLATSPGSWPTTPGRQLRDAGRRPRSYRRSSARSATTRSSTTRAAICTTRRAARPSSRPTCSSIPRSPRRPRELPAGPDLAADRRGKPTLAPVNDLDRFSRPYDGDGDLIAVADIGAFEYPSGEVFDLVFTGRDLLDWDVVMFAEDQAFNLYRGALALLKSGAGYTQDPLLPIPERFCYIDPRQRPFVDSYSSALR